MDRIETLIKFALAKGIGAVTVNRLLAHFGDADRILGASESELRRVEGMREGQLAAVRAAAEIDPRPELELAAKHNVNIISFGDALYPRALKTTYDPPFLLYIRGELKPEDNLAFGVVGTRQASLYGREQAERFGGLLARAGFTVTSGLARGIDSFAHRGALNAGGRTVAVIGCGLAHLYPEENRDLAAEIAGSGAVVSELPMDVSPSKENFPRRNRIIAGMSLGVLVVEAPLRSGAMITARQALEMNREVFALPGRVDQDNASGCNSLIRDGAVLTRGLEDILQELGPVSDEVAKRVAAAGAGAEAGAPAEAGAMPRTRATANGAEGKILAVLGGEPMHIDQICAATGLAVAEVSSALVIMEIKRAVAPRPGKFFVKC